MPAVIAVAGRHSLSRRPTARAKRHESLRSPESIPAASLSVVPLFTLPRATLRPRLRSKMSQGRNGPAAGQKLPHRHRRQDCALAAARRLVNKSSDDLHRASALRARPCLVGGLSPPARGRPLPARPGAHVGPFPCPTGPALTPPRRSARHPDHAPPSRRAPEPATGPADVLLLHGARWGRG